MEYRKRIVEQQTGHFKTHVAKYWKMGGEPGVPQVEMIRFQQPGTSNYFIEFIFTNGTLFVRGDLGEAVYCWHYSMKLRGLRNVDIGYMKGKCEASEVGKPYNGWNEEVAKEALLYHLTEYVDDDKVYAILDEKNVIPEDGEDFSDEQWEKSKNDYGQSILNKILEEISLHSQDEWVHWLNDDQDAVIKLLNDQDYWEWAYSIGTVPATRMIIHNVAIKLALIQIIEKEHFAILRDMNSC